VRSSSDSSGNIRRIREEVEIRFGFRKRFWKLLRISESSNSGKIGEENFERERDRDSFEISLRESFEFAQGREQGSFLGRN
jgi:hypothetical protein